MKLKRTYLFCILLFFLLRVLHGQEQSNIYPNDDPCGYDSAHFVKLKNALGDHWGYGYANLLDDIDLWNLNIYVSVSNIGNSVEGREIPILTLAKVEEKDASYRIAIHARTHPAEVQSTHVTNQIINQLLADTGIAPILLEECIFNIIPMINPDGVELEYNRQNANMVDIESNWNTFPHEPEVTALKNTYLGFMNSTLPIRVALNMHSALQCKRFFVYHHSAGTSVTFAEDEKEFITSIRNYWPGGIQNWDHYVSWTSGTPLYYPESWFWTNYGESVMALTYEDMNCATAGEYDKTARVMLKGISDFLGITTRNDYLIAKENELKIFPNPGTTGEKIKVLLTENKDAKRIEIYNMMGILQDVEIDVNSNDYLIIYTTNLVRGKYILRITTGRQQLSGMIVLM